MLPKHHLLQLVPNRVNAVIERLQAGVWQETEAVPVFATKASPEQIQVEAARKQPLREVLPGSNWGKLFDQRWCRIAIPKSKKRVWLNWRDQGEANLYVDGVPYFGFDVAHRFCELPAETEEVWIESHCIQSAIWHSGASGLKLGSQFEGAFLCQRNEDFWTAFHDLRCLLDLALDQRSRENERLPAALNNSGRQPTAENLSPIYRQMLRMMDEAVNEFELYGVGALRKALSQTYSALRVDKTFMRCILTGHAHIDLVWLWPERIGEVKALHTFSTVNRLMEEYPDFRFAYSQPASYEAVKRRSPKLANLVSKRIRQGKWQATGALYVESDTLLACGEALTRSFILGQEGFRELTGSPSRLAWLPDVFGYSACLPQIMRQMGVDYFFTTKMTYNAVNRFPYSSFVWKGSDGSKVLAHIVQNVGYNTQLSVDEVKQAMHGHQQSDVHFEYLLPTGFGDGGGGPTAEMCERAKRLGSLPGMPAMQWDQPENFFDRLARKPDLLPSYQGECYLEAHRGTFTTHGKLKDLFRRLERALQLAEAVECSTGKRWDLQHHWKRLVFSQFHDYIPGSSVWDVYLEGLPELERLAAEQTAKSIEELSSSEAEGLSIFNQHAVPIKRWVIPSETKDAVYVSLPPLSGMSISRAVATERVAPLQMEGSTISNGLVEFKVNSQGWIDRLEWEGCLVPLSDPLGQLMIFPDCAANFEAWDIDRSALAIGNLCTEAPIVTAFRDGKHRAGVRVVRKVGKASSATVVYALEAGSFLVDISISIDWQEPENLLKMLFPTRYAGTYARFGAPFGSVLRPQVTSGISAETMWEVPFSRYVAVFDEGEREGLFITSEAKYGATVREGTVGISLVRSPRVTGYEHHRGAWPAHLHRLKMPSTYSDLGEHRVRLAIGGYRGDLPRERQPASVAETRFSEPVIYRGDAVSSPLKSIEGDATLVPAWTKPCEDGSWILRLHEVGGCRGEVKLRIEPGWKVEIVDLKEKAGKTLRSPNAISFKPYEIVSLRFRQVA